MTDVYLSTFQDRLRVRALRERIPLSCVFEITPACNLRCHFCYVALDPYAGPYLSTAQVEAVLDRLREAGVLWLVLTGGEIFSRRDFADIYLGTLRRGFSVTLYTNATLVSERIADLLAAHPPRAVEVSIYGADAQHYEATTGIPGSFARFERGVDRLRRAGVRLLLKHPLSTLTADHVPAMRAWCAARRLPFKIGSVLENRHDGGTEPSLYRIEPRTLRDVRDEIHEMATGTKRTLPLAECSERTGDPGEEERLYRCAAGRSSFFVDALGQASHCVIDRQPSFPILETPWAELWAKIGDWVGQALPAEAPCSGCGLRPGCDNCPARARLASGDPYGRDPYHCELTHAEHGLPRPAWVASKRSRPLGACAS